MSKNWAITIGINQYDNLQDLEFAKRDAEEMRSFFLRDLNLSANTIYHFTEDSDPIPADGGQVIKSQPTYATLRRFLRIRFDKPFLNPQDNLWFFFAGHGVQYEDRDYLMPLDGDPGDVKNTAIPLNYVTERLRRCGAENVILFVDACRSRTRSGLGIGDENQAGVVTFYACSPREQSYEIDDPEIRHGAFTYALLEGLRLQSAGQNCATVERLNYHLVRQVPQLNQTYGKPMQTPYSRIEPLNKGHLILLPKLATVADLNCLKMDAFRAETTQNIREAVQLWRRVLAKDGTDNDAFDAIQRLALMQDVPAPAPIDRPPPSPPSRQVAEDTSRSPSISTVEPQKPISQSFSEDLGGIAISMVRIPAGQFLMGSPDSELERFDQEGPQHEVSVSEFCMSQYPVTQAQWARVSSLPQVKTKLKATPSKFRGHENPVEMVSWYEAMEFCARLSKQTGKTYQLPTEAQWEYACRAGTQTPFYFGETITPDQANYDGNYTYGNGSKGVYRQKTTTVGTFPANDFGVYDMHGNVWEWCLDHGHQSYDGAPNDCSAWLTSDEKSFRLLRGGSWFNDPGLCRSAFRHGRAPGFQHDLIGFRVVYLSSRAF